MKKFLTVLLALSVVFTYTFGTAGSVFAAESKTPNYDSARDAVLAELEASYNSATAALKDGDAVYNVGEGSYNIKLDARALKEVASKVYNDYKEVIQKQYESLTAGGVDAASAADAKTAFNNSDNAVNIDYLSLKNAYYGQVAGYDAFLAVVKGTDSDTLYLDALFNALLPYNKAYVLEELDKVDLGAYSDAVMDANDPFKTTYAEKAAQVVKDAKAAVNDISFTESDTNATKAAALEKLAFVPNTIETFNTDGSVATTTDKSSYAYIVVGGENVSLTPSAGYKTIDDEIVTTKYILNGVEKLATADALKADQAQDTANRAAYKAYVEKKYAETYANYLQLGLSKDVLATKVEELDKYKAVALAIIEEGTAAQARVWGTEGAFTDQLAAAPGRYDVYADAEKRAEILKLATDKTGELLYDAAVIDDNMTDLKMKVYYDAQATVTTAEIVDGAAISGDSFAWDKEVALAQNEAARADALGADDKYYAPEKDAVNALFDKRAEEINGCTTSAQIKKVTQTPVTVPSTIKDAETIVAEFVNALGNAGLGDQLATAKKYIEVKNDGKYSNDPTRIKISDDNLKTLMAETFAENGARTNTAAKALMDKVYAAIDAYPTQGAQKTNVKAVQDAIDALPSTITAADKATVQTAYDMLDALTPEEKAAVDSTRLNRAIAALKKIAEDEINAAIKALPASPTAADKAAVEAAQALIDAYDDEVLWSDTWAEGALDAKFEAVRKAELKDVMEAIYKLGENPTKEAVEAARAAYDAYVAYWTDAESNDNAADDVVNDKTLFYAEAQIKAKDIKAVEALKITASSTAKKGSITVKWTVKGDSSAADGFQVYRSLKMNSGFGTKAFFTTTDNTKRTYKNTKSLKKGTRYYYKIRAYKVVDGVKYYSDWSNKAYRIAK